MSDRLAYYNDGKEIFAGKEQIYINKAFEQPYMHLHAHNFIEIAYVASGQGIHIIRDKEYTISKGDLFIINYNVPHEFRSVQNSKKSELVVYNCIFKPEFLDRQLKDSMDFMDIIHYFSVASQFPKEQDEHCDIKLLGNYSHEIEDIYQKMHYEYQIKAQGYIEFLKACVIQLLIIIFRFYCKDNQLGEKIKFQKRQIVDKVIGYIKDNYSKELKLEHLSEITFMSRNYLCKLFKEAANMTIFEYVQKIRMDEACRLLKNSDRKVIDIAVEVGYSDIKFFNKIFKRITGKTPGKYRAVW